MIATKKGRGKSFRRDFRSKKVRDNLTPTILMNSIKRTKNKKFH